MADLDEFFKNERETNKRKLFEKKELEYNLHFIEGEFGAGKTLYLTWCAFVSQGYYDFIYSNYPLYIGNAEYIPEITREVLFDLNPDPENKKALLCLQEAYHYFDRRYWGERNNRNIMKALFQIRKLNVDIVADIRDLLYIDFRIIQDATHFLKADRQLKHFPGYFEYVVYVAKRNRFGNIDFVEGQHLFLYMANLFDKYDTMTKTVDMSTLEADDE